MKPRFEKIICTTMPPLVMKERLSLLEQLLQRSMPRSVQLIVQCRLGIEGKYPPSNLIQFYKYEEGESSWPENGNQEEPFVVCIQRPNIISKKGIILMAPEHVTDNMVDAFDNFLGWDSPQAFGSVHEPFSQILLKLCKQHGELSPPDGIPCHFFSILDIEKAKNLRVDEEFLSRNKLVIRRLKSENVSQSVLGWLHTQEHTEQELKNNLKRLYSSGLFTENGELASSFMHTTTGLFNGLYTPEKFRRKGYGHVLTTWLAKTVAEQLGLPPMVEADILNIASKKLLEKVGLEEIYRSRWLFYKPKTK